MKSLPIIIGIIIVVALAGGTYFFVKGSPQATPAPIPNTELEQLTQSASPISTSESTDSGETQMQAKEFTVVGSSFKFSPNEVKVKKGDKVKITFKNNQGTHDLFIDGYNVGTKVIGANKEEVLEFTADKAGTFDFWCTVGNHKAQGMVGKLIVE